MKRNLLMLLFAILVGTFTAKADMNVTVNIDKGANAYLATGSPYGDPIDLTDGQNDLTLPINGGPVFVMPSNGATIQSVTCDGMPANFNGGYNGYQCLPKEGSVIDIVTEGDVPATVSMMFYLNNLGTAYITSGEDTYQFTENYLTLNLPAGEYATIHIAEGYALSELSPSMIEDITENEDGTITFMPAANGYIGITTKKAGIDFFVDVVLPQSVKIQTFNAMNEELGLVELEGWQKPYSGTADLATVSIAFDAAEGCEISSVKRVTAEGEETELRYSPYAGGYRSSLAAGDTFIIESLGAESTVKFWGYDQTTRGELDLSNFVVMNGDTRIELEGVSADATVRAGQILSIGTGRGYTLGNYAVSGDCGKSVETTGPVQTYLVTGPGNIFIYATPVTDMTINVDNAAAVTVAGMNGMAAALELKDGENKFETVVNPLKIRANEKYNIDSVVLDGVTLDSTDGTYTAELLAGGTLTITTSKEPDPYPLTITTMNGEVSDLIIMRDDEVVEYGPETPLLVKNGEDIKIKAALGSIIESLDYLGGGKPAYDEDTQVYTVTTANDASMISVMFRKPAEGMVFVGFTSDTSDIHAYIYEADGESRSDDHPSVKINTTVEIHKGDMVELDNWYSTYQFKTVKVNGVEIDFKYNGEKTLEKIKIDENSVIEVTTEEKLQYVTVWGQDNIDEITGVPTGSIYINEVGQQSVALLPGDRFFAIPVADKGYKFDGFREITGNPEIPEPVDGKYEFIVPDGVEFFFLKGNFVVDTDNPAYLIEGNTIYDDGIELERKMYGITRIDNGTERGALIETVYEGETVRLLFFQNIDDFPIEEYYNYSFCLFNNPEKLIPQDYVVNPADVRDSNVISIGAIIKKRGGDSGIGSVAAEGALSYDHATATIASATAVKVFTAGGQLVKELPAGESSIESLPAGVYVIVNETEFVKIAK